MPVVHFRNGHPRGASLRRIFPNGLKVGLAEFFEDPFTTYSGIGFPVALDKLDSIDKYKLLCFYHEVREDKPSYEKLQACGISIPLEVVASTEYTEDEMERIFTSWETLEPYQKQMMLPLIYGGLETFHALEAFANKETTMEVEVYA